MSTRDKILEAAEVLFAAHGYSGTSLRDITDAADVNVASVNYHFGSKEQLLVALLDRIIAPINAERLELLDQVEGEDEPDLDSILTAFLLPDIRSLHALRERDPSLPRFVSRMYGEASELMNQVMATQFSEVAERFGRAMARALPHLSADELSFRLTCIVGIVVYMFAGISAANVSPLTSGDEEGDLTRLLTVARSVMTAPPTGR